MFSYPILSLSVSKAVINPPPPAAPQGIPGALMPMPILVPPAPSTSPAAIVAGDDPVPIIHRVFRSCLGTYENNSDKNAPFDAVFFCFVLGTCLCPSPRLEDWQVRDSDILSLSCVTPNCLLFPCSCACGDTTCAWPMRRRN